MRDFFEQPHVPEENLDELLNDEMFERDSISDSPYFNGLMAC